MPNEPTELEVLEIRFNRAMQRYVTTIKKFENVNTVISPEHGMEATTKTFNEMSDQLDKLTAELEGK
jgi:nitrate/nitrite-specific signal transduction histidine kinase